MATEKIEIKSGHSYMCMRGMGVFKIKIMDATQTCYRIEWESGAVTWETKESFKWHYQIIEDLGLKQ